jgi:hypothetical protein
MYAFMVYPFWSGELGVVRAGKDEPGGRQTCRMPFTDNITTFNQIAFRQIRYSVTAEVTLGNDAQTTHALEIPNVLALSDQQ